MSSIEKPSHPFKVGDVVYCIDDSNLIGPTGGGCEFTSGEWKELPENSSLIAGHAYRVADIGHYYIGLEGRQSDDGYNWSYLPRRFSLVPPSALNVPRSLDEIERAKDILKELGVS